MPVLIESSGVFPAVSPAGARKLVKGEVGVFEYQQHRVHDII
jgi:hypothetical protein